ncbi:hypothetical protein CAPTEDRAFT_203717 [Capitella teleta]|uniref:LRRCT domain-containing protein n=1 Tax=Capitella teleta TaxID=283909 RepID=R7US67_CAPTE|nr:hypothetical protein CAPTEDRAFT_203717 [Capitella teleta]|eukprot:ELU09040.1 hypothetical protein CAPTEDRAFT_203717 [Capitella teleta]
MKVCPVLWLLACLVNFKERLCENVDSSNKGLTSVPEAITPNVTELDLNSNHITRIQQTDFNDKYTDLDQISLRDNGITSIESGCFKGTILTNLLLTSNELTFIPDLHEVSNTLIHLNLNSNEITTIEVDELSYLIKLTELYLSFNQLSTLPDIIQFMPSLQVLGLQENPLDCCCSNVWLKQKPSDLTLYLSTHSCIQPTGWSSTTWDDITKDMILRQPCQASSSHPRLCDA